MHTGSVGARARGFQHHAPASSPGPGLDPGPGPAPCPPRLRDRRHNRGATTARIWHARIEEPPALAGCDQPRIVGAAGVLRTALDDGAEGFPATPVFRRRHVESSNLPVEAPVCHEVATGRLHDAGRLRAVRVAVTSCPGADRYAESLPPLAGVTDGGEDPRCRAVAAS